MSEKEEKLINKICKLQKAHNSLKLEDEIEKYKSEIKEAEKYNENTKNEIKKLSSELIKFENSDKNNSSSVKEKNIENKQNILDNLINGNNIMLHQLNLLKLSADNYKNENYILRIIQNWNPQTMFKFIELYKKKSE